MRYEEAQELKIKIGESFEKDGVKYKTVIVPMDESDFDKFIQNYREFSYLEHPGELFSSNGEYVLCGLWTDGVNVISKRDLSEYMDQ